MASNKTYTVVKDGGNLKELKTLAAAKKLADAEGAKVLCDGECVYQGAVTAIEDTVTDTVVETAAEEEKPATSVPEKYTLLSRMNIRKAPSKDADKLGIAEKGTVVDVTAIENDWMHLADGSFILFEGGRFAVKN
ncbi:MAG: SH3 domain-containing protein [Eubacteriales bacterium]|nr:SH3 domain-containing protein [Eubacteriales bacterium]